MTRSAILFAALAAVAFPAFAQSIDSDWREVASASDGRCAISVTGTGQIYRIGVSGLEPGETGRFQLNNGDMTPIEWTVRADGNGGFARFYMPFRWHREGGTVTISVSSADCSVSASFPWQRAGVKVG